MNSIKTRSSDYRKQFSSHIDRSSQRFWESMRTHARGKTPEDLIAPKKGAPLHFGIEEATCLFSA